MWETFWYTITISKRYNIAKAPRDTNGLRALASTNNRLNRYVFYSHVIENCGSRPKLSLSPCQRNANHWYPNGYQDVILSHLVWCHNALILVFTDDYTGVCSNEWNNGYVGEEVGVRVLSLSAAVRLFFCMATDVRAIIRVIVFQMILKLGWNIFGSISISTMSIASFSIYA